MNSAFYDGLLSSNSMRESWPWTQQGQVPQPSPSFDALGARGYLDALEGAEELQTSQAGSEDLLDVVLGGSQRRRRPSLSSFDAPSLLNALTIPSDSLGPIRREEEHTRTAARRPQEPQPKGLEKLLREAAAASRGKEAKATWQPERKTSRPPFQCGSGVSGSRLPASTSSTVLESDVTGPLGGPVDQASALQRLIARSGAPAVHQHTAILQQLLEKHLCENDSCHRSATGMHPVIGRRTEKWPLLEQERGARARDVLPQTQALPAISGLSAPSLCATLSAGGTSSASWGLRTSMEKLGELGARGAPSGNASADVDGRKLRRMAANREAARRMRKRQADRLAELEAQIAELKRANEEAERRLNQANAKVAELEEKNARLAEEARETQARQLPLEKAGAAHGTDFKPAQARKRPRGEVPLDGALEEAQKRIIRKAACVSEDIKKAPIEEDPFGVESDPASEPEQLLLLEEMDLETFLSCMSALA